MYIDANIDGMGWLALQGVSALNRSLRGYLLCVVNYALPDGETSLGLMLVLIFDVRAIQDHGDKGLEAWGQRVFLAFCWEGTSKFKTFVAEYVFSYYYSSFRQDSSIFIEVSILQCFIQHVSHSFLENDNSVSPIKLILCFWEVFEQMIFQSGFINWFIDAEFPKTIHIHGVDFRELKKESSRVHRMFYIAGQFYKWSWLIHPLICEFRCMVCFPSVTTVAISKLGQACQMVFCFHCH